MPNKRGAGVQQGDLETANPFAPGRFAEAEPQSRRGAPGSRGMNEPVSSRQQGRRPQGGEGGNASYSGVNPLDPIDPAMPQLKTGDQGG